MDNQTLRLPPDFKVGDKVIDEANFYGMTGVVTKTNCKGKYPIQATFSGQGQYGHAFYLPNGSQVQGMPPDLIRLEEGDKAAHDSDTDDMDSIVTPSLQTFTDIAEWIAKTSQNINGSWVVGNKSLNTEELHLMYVIQGKDNTTKP